MPSQSHRDAIEISMKRIASSENQHNPKALRLSTSEDGAVVLRVETSRAEPADEIRSLASWARIWGLEQAGLRRAVTLAGIPLVRVGRSVCARRSDVLSIADKLAQQQDVKKSDSPVDYEAVVAMVRGEK